MIKQLLLVCVFLTTIHINSQTNQSVNRIYGSISIPIFIDEFQKTDFTDDNSLDGEKKEIDKKWMLSTQLNNIPIKILYKSKLNLKFEGTGETYYGSTIMVEGKIKLVEELLDIRITESLKQKDESFEEKKEVNYYYRNLKATKSIKSTDKITAYTCILRGTPIATVDEYSYFIKKKSRYLIETWQKELKGIDRETLQIKIKSPFPLFNFTIYWDGTNTDDLIKKSIAVTKIRDEKPNWEPLSVNYLRKGIEPEPNSIGVYASKIKIINENKTELTKPYTGLQHGFPALIISDLSKIPGIKVLERGNIDKILQEIKLSESGLVKEDTKVENKLEKEEMAVIVKLEIDAEKETFNTKCYVQSKNKEIVIKSSNLPLRHLFEIQNALTKEILKEVIKQFNISVDLKKID